MLKINTLGKIALCIGLLFSSALVWAAKPSLPTPPKAPTMPVPPVNGIQPVEPGSFVNREKNLSSSYDNDGINSDNGCINANGVESSC